MRALTSMLVLAVCVGFVSADEICLTGNARRHQNLALQYTVQPQSALPLFDGSIVDRQSVGMQDGPVTLTFAEPMRITRVQVIVYNDPKRSYNAAGRFRAEGSRDGTVAEETAWSSLDGDDESLVGTDDALCLGSQSQVQMLGAKAIDTLKIELEKRPGAYQMLVREIRVWGIPERLANAPFTPIACKVSENTCASIRVTWDKTPPGTQYVRISYRPRGEKTWTTECFAQSPGLLLWPSPGREYEVRAEAVGAPAARASNIPPQIVRLPLPLENRTMGDVWGMNFYPGGGGAHQARTDESGNTKRMIELLREAGVRHVRWWVASPGAAEMLAENGISLLPSVTSDNPEAYKRLAQSAGIWITQTTNEPDFSNTFAEKYVPPFISRRAAAKRFSPQMLLAGPAIGGEMVGSGSDYLAACYAAGLKDAVDAVDLHPYGKLSTPVSPGGIIGGPEGLIYSIMASRDVMRKMGDAARPVIVSETGHPTYEGEWFMPASSYERQAQWVVRTHLILAALNVRRLYWYAFEDEGTDKHNPEHCFGIVDWYGQPKPAYETYRVMTRLLSDARCDGLEVGLKPPAYGVRASSNGGYITALWDAGGESEVQVKADSSITRIVSLKGEKLPVPPASGGQISLTADENVRYVFSRRPLSYTAQRRVTSPVAPQVRMALLPSTVIVTPGQPVQWTARLTNEFPCPVKVALSTPHPWEGEFVREEAVVPAKSQLDVKLHFDTPPILKPQIASWDTRCRYEPQDAKWQPAEFRMAIFFIVPERSASK